MMLKKDELTNNEVMELNKLDDEMIKVNDFTTASQIMEEFGKSIENNVTLIQKEKEKLLVLKSLIKSDLKYFNEKGFLKNTPNASNFRVDCGTCVSNNFWLLVIVSSIVIVLDIFACLYASAHDVKPDINCLVVISGTLLIVLTAVCPTCVGPAPTPIND